MEKYVILEKRLDSWFVTRWGFSGVTYDTFYEALHDCHKGDRIIKYSQYLQSKELYG